MQKKCINFERCGNSFEITPYNNRKEYCYNCAVNTRKIQQMAYYWRKRGRKKAFKSVLSISGVSR